MAGIWVAAWMLPTISFRQGESDGYTIAYLALIALILTIVNRAIRPIASVLTFPLYLLTLGLFAVVINGLMFGLTAWLSGIVNVPLVVDGWGAAILGGTITAIVSSIVAGILKALIPKV